MRAGGRSISLGLADAFAGKLDYPTAGATTRQGGRVMSIMEPGEKRRSITATLAIPHEAIRIVAPSPDTLSQRNVEAVTGIPARIYLEAVRRAGFPLRV